mgnify:CR=1 FL=1
MSGAIVRLLTCGSVDDGKSTLIGRLLVETDSPYLAPVPHRGKMNQPALVSVVGTSIAELRQSSPEHIAHITSANALRAFPKMRVAA